jgi:DNA polymerase-1
MSSRRLILIDGTFSLYRSFFAIKHLTANDGTPTNALFGFVRLLGQLREQWRPTHWAVVFDGGLPERRLALLPQYKAQRPPMPPDLRRQFPLAEEYLTAARVPWLRIASQEADDVMATLAVRAARECERVLLFTSDKDLYQLVGGPVAMLSSGAKGEVLDATGIRERTGVPPERVADWLALVGDHVDNIPGVPGVGPKTAASLIDTFGSIEALWPRLGEIRSERVRGALAESRPVVERNLAMVRLDTAVPVSQGLDELTVQSEDRARLLAFYERMGFATLARGLREPDMFGEMGS